MPINPYDPPNDEPARRAEERGLWPRARQRRERLVHGTLRAWAWLGLRALVFALVVAALIYLSQMNVAP